MFKNIFQYFQRGTKAPQAAGKIHTDFEKGFIMAEVMKFDDFKNEGSEAAVKVSTYPLLIIIKTRRIYFNACSFFFITGCWKI